MTQSVIPSAPTPAHAMRAYYAPPRIAGVLQLIGLLGATALLGGAIIASLLVGILALLTSAGH